MLLARTLGYNWEMLRDHHAPFWVLAWFWPGVALYLITVAAEVWYVLRRRSSLFHALSISMLRILVIGLWPVIAVLLAHEKIVALLWKRSTDNSP